MHVASLWHVALATDPTFTTIVASAFRSGTVTLVESGILSGLTVSTNYIARVRYYDDLGNVSAWSDSFAFTTLGANTQPEPGAWEDCEHDQAA